VDRSVAQGRRTDPWPWLAATAVGVVAFAAGWLALLPGVGFWDTAEFQAVGPLLGTAHPTGFPTYVLLSWLASVLLQPFGEPAFRVNLLSAICVGVAAAVTTDLVRVLTRSIALGVAAGIGLALTPIVWSIGTHADPHALHLALVAVILRLLIGWEDRVREDRPDADRWLVAASIAFGLSVGNHSLTLLLAIPVGLFVLIVLPSILRRPRLMVLCAGALTVTVALVYLELPLRAGPFPAALVYGRPDTLDGFRYVVLAEQFRGSLQDPFGDLPSKFRQLVDLTVQQFGILAPLIPIGFVVTCLRRPAYAFLTGTAVAITCFFAASYVNAEIQRYYLGPILIAWTWLAILAAALVDQLAEVRGGRPLPAVAGLLAVLLLVPMVGASAGTFRDVDRSNDRQAASWLDDTLPRLEPNAVVVSWWSYSTPLWYAQRVEGLRPDIVIVDDRTRLDQDLGSVTDVIDANLGHRPVYVMRETDPQIQEITDRYDVEDIAPAGQTWLVRVIGPKAAA
jgi:Protein of unknown function (DUF2723)